MGCEETKINAIVVVWLDCSRWMDDGMSEKTMDGWMHGWMNELRCQEKHEWEGGCMDG